LGFQSSGDTISGYTIFFEVWDMVCVVECVGLWWRCGAGGAVGEEGGRPLRSNIPRSAFCATLDTYNFTKWMYFIIKGGFGWSHFSDLPTNGLFI
jgi:hypothetical protein